MIKQIEMTIYEALANKLGREPTRVELKADVQRIISEGAAEAVFRRAQGQAGRLFKGAIK